MNSDPRHDGRSPRELRPLLVTRGFTRTTPGSVLIQAGRTTILCTASVTNEVPAWMVGKGKGWVTAEYNMLPGSTAPRKPRERAGKVDGRTTEIQRLIGRSLRAIVDLYQLGERSVNVDCDVLEADGGTRTLSITGAYIALHDALSAQEGGDRLARSALRDQVAAVSVGIVNGTPVLDLDYQEDFAATVDMNVVMTGRGQFVEIQGTGEESTFSDDELAALLQLARQGIQQLAEFQRTNLHVR